MYGGSIQHVDVTAGYGTRSYALFGQSTYSLTNILRLTGGLRLTSDERSIGDGNFYYLQPSLVGPTSSCFVPLVIKRATECVADRYAGNKTFENVSWKAGFEMDVFGNDLLYGNVSRGFKAGGFNTQSTAEAPGGANTVGGAQLFQPETLTAYEGGFKSRFLHNRVQVNHETYYWDYNDHQEPKLSSTASGATNLIYFNAGKSRIYGFDLTTLARPWSRATVNGSLGFADSRYETS